MNVRWAKHLSGWRTSKRLVAFCVDDYGAVRLANRAAGEALAVEIDGFGGRMDQFDSLETRADLQALFETLDSVRDGAGRGAIFSAYALSANPDFEAMRETGHYAYEPVTETFARCAAEDPEAYEGAWAVLHDGMDKGLIRPQFHGREHVSVALLTHKLQAGDADLQANLRHNSMAGLKTSRTLPGVGFSHAFGFFDDSLLAAHEEILRDGLQLFQDVYGLASTTFTPPAHKLHPALIKVAHDAGIVAIDTPFAANRPGKHLPKVSFLRPDTIVRSLAFEPTNGQQKDHVAAAMREIATAFRFRQPAIISSHRVNYAGHIDEANRAHGLRALKDLLHAMIWKWPDIEFVAIDDLADRMTRAAGRT